MKKILIVDDEVKLVKSIKTFFSLKGVDVITAYSGEEALSLLKENHGFSLMITDVVMPGISGIELLKKVKKDFPEMHVVVMTGMLSIENTVSSLQNGASDYLLKPFSSLDYVWEVVKNYIE